MMGCDIHLYFERKIGENWERIDIDNRLIPDDRDYRVFSFLAGVRNYWDDKPKFKCRGIPLHTSMPENETNDFWLGDHSFTHAYLDEFDDLDWGELQGCYFQVFVEHVLPRLLCICGYHIAEQKRNIRIIMGFDN